MNSFPFTVAGGVRTLSRIGSPLSGPRRLSQCTCRVTGFQTLNGVAGRAVQAASMYERLRTLVGPDLVDVSAAQVLHGMKHLGISFVRSKTNFRI
jgi:hypothetical protein